MLLTALISLLSIPATFAVSHTTPPAGAIVVRQTGATAGQFTTIGAAMASLSGTALTVFIFPGTYNEQVNITHPSLTIMGSTTESYKQNTVTITHNLNAQDNGGNDACATVRATSATTNLRIYNVNIVNSFGPGKQATALSATGTRQGFYRLSVTGYQDTLLADGGGALHYQYYSNCYIEGAVDYIYGSASAWFGECTIASNGGGAITANSRDSTTDSSYYVIDSSVITSTVSTSLVGDVYLGRLPSSAPPISPNVVAITVVALPSLIMLRISLYLGVVVAVVEMDGRAAMTSRAKKQVEAVAGSN
ncbi:pectin methyl esterase [Mycena leptocephala]|nr:pectin methyl esterase [Mycena leptocephala]